MKKVSLGYSVMYLSQNFKMLRGDWAQKLSTKKVFWRDSCTRKKMFEHAMRGDPSPLEDRKIHNGPSYVLADQVIYKTLCWDGTLL